MSETSGPRIAVIGGGIAGISAAAALIGHPSRPTVTLLEAEGQLAHHTTGRSAAQLIENYGADAVRPLTRASLPYFRSPPPEHCPSPLLRNQPVLTVGRPDQDEVIEAALVEGRRSNPDIDEITPAEAGRLFPPLRTERLSRVIIEPGSSDIDVAALHQAFVRAFAAGGGRVETLARVDAATRPAAGQP
ncbi:MAG: FAD-dependent oxidoreductase, partial [Actinomycetota bacterium]